jgi:DnaJ-class molecular chaperone
MSDADDRENPPEVEVECPDCHGKEEVVRYHCMNCDGTGYVPTDLGRKVLALMCRNLGRVLRDATER